MKKGLVIRCFITISIHIPSRDSQCYTKVEEDSAYVSLREKGTLVFLSDCVLLQVFVDALSGEAESQ